MTRSADSFSRELTRALQEKVEAQEGLRKKLVAIAIREQWVAAIMLVRVHPRFDRDGFRSIASVLGLHTDILDPPVLVVARYLGEKP